MRSYASNAVAESSSASNNRRQPLRQARTNPSRSTTLVGPWGSGGTRAAQDGGQNTEIGFFPAITHFTDAISALPKEMVRHYSMLKEVDAKICTPEDNVGQIITTALRIPAPPRKPNLTQTVDTSRSEADTAPSTAGTADNISVVSVPSRIEAASTATRENLATLDLSRRELFKKLRKHMQEMLPILDEKNQVLSIANDCLENQLKRCDSSYRHMDNELSEEARYGSLTHWAYNTEKTADKKGTTAGERSRRDVAAANHLAANAPAVHEAEGAALRSELRREAIAARKSKNQHLEPDLDEARGPNGKKAQAAGKGRKATDATSSSNGATVGLGVANAIPAAPPSKRRKLDKAATGAPMVRAMSSVYGSNPGSNRGAATSPRATPALEPPKKRGRVAAVPNGTGRKRANTNTSAAHSPSMASSPVVGTFPTSKDALKKSPAPSLMQRIPSSRGRQNSTQSLLAEARNRPPSVASSKAAVSNGSHGPTADAEKVAGTPEKSTNDIRISAKEMAHADEGHVIEENRRDDDDALEGVVPSSRGRDKPLKKDDVETAGPDRPRSISTSTRGGGTISIRGGGTISTRGGGKSSKTSTPTHGSFTESQRTRPVRGVDPAKRSHKKGAGLAAQLAAAVHGDDDDEHSTELRYCYCNQISYGEMVACDGEDCPREWFHLDCVGLNKAPKGAAKWYCDECKENVKKGKVGNGNGR